MKLPSLCVGVLAGGASARMGRDKAGVVAPTAAHGDECEVGALASARGNEAEVVAHAASTHGGKLEAGITLGERAVAVARMLTDDVVVLGHGRAMPAHLARIPDADAVAGPLAGVLALLRSGRAARYLVLAVDMPGVTGEVLRALVNTLDEGERDDRTRAACLTFEQRLEPLPCALRAEVLGDVEECVTNGARSLVAVLGTMGVRTVAITDRAVIRNVNTLADFDDGAPGTPDR